MLNKTFHLFDKIAFFSHLKHETNTNWTGLRPKWRISDRLSGRYFHWRPGAYKKRPRAEFSPQLAWPSSQQHLSVPPLLLIATMAVCLLPTLLSSPWSWVPSSLLPTRRDHPGLPALRLLYRSGVTFASRAVMQWRYTYGEYQERVYHPPLSQTDLFWDHSLTREKLNSF